MSEESGERLRCILNFMLNYFVRTARALYAAVLFTVTGATGLYAQDMRIVGSVTDYASLEPMAGADIIVRGNVWWTVSDSAGHFELKLPAGEYTVQASFTGYVTQEKKISPTDTLLFLNFALQEETLLLDEVVVTGTGTEHFLRNAPVQTEVITSEALKQYSGKSLEDILYGLSPAFDFSQGDMGSGISMGGLGNSYILVLVDGKRLYGDLGGQNDIDMIDPSDIERIEIVKGASSSLYGSDAIAGVVNIITRKHRMIPFMVENNTHLGEYFDIRQSDAVSFTIGQFQSSTKISVQHTDGWQITDRELYRDSIYSGSTTQTVSEYTNGRISEELTWRPSGNLEITASGMFYTKYLVHRPGLPRWRSYNPLYRDQAYSAGARWKPEDGIDITIDATFNQHKYMYDYYLEYIDEYYRHYETPDGDTVRIPAHLVYFPGDKSVESNQRLWTVHAKGIFSLPYGNRLSAGVEFMDDQLIAPRRMITARESAYTLSAYAQDEWTPAEWLNVTAGVRMVLHEAFGIRATPKVSLMFKAGNWNFRGTYSNGFKAPTTKELYYFYERAMMGKLRLYIGNTALTPQTSHYFSIGPEYRGRKLTFSMTASYNLVNDMIALVSVPIPPEYYTDEGSEYDGAMQYINMENARIWNAEAMLTWNPGAGFTISGGYTFTHTEGYLVDTEASEEAGHTVMETRPLDGTAAHRATFRAGWGHDWEKYGLTIGLFGRGQTEKYYKEYGNAPGYMLWRLTTTHRIGNWKNWDLELSLGIDNILNHVETHPYGYNYGTTSPGRTFFGSVRVRFGKDS